MEVKCRLCGGETNQKDFCRPCELFRTDEVEALKRNDNPKGTGLKKAAAVGRSNEANLADECPITNTMPTGPRVISRSKNKNNGGVKMARKHKTCSKCNTEQKSNRALSCYKCGEAFTVKQTTAVIKVKKRKYTRRTVISTKAASGITEKGKNKKGNGDYEGVMLKLINAKSDYQQKLSKIESAIEVIQQYA